MRNSSERTLIWGVLVAMIIGLLSLYFFQSAWLKMIQIMLAKTSESSALPISSTPVSNFSFPTAAAPVGVGVEVTHSNVAITVTRVLSPADGYIGKSAQYTSLKAGQEYLLVDVKVRCLSKTEKCYVNELDFGVRGDGGGDYVADLSSFYDLPGMYEGGEIEPGRSLSGSLVFVIDAGQHGLVMSYPHMFAFGGSAQFVLTK